MSETPSKSGIARLLAGITGSAESFIAVALLAVVVVVGGALWWFSGQEAPAEAEVRKSASATVAAVDENAAIDDYKRRMGEQFNEINQQRRRAEDEEERRARVKAEEAAAADAQRRADKARAEAEAKQRAAAPAAAVAPARVVAASIAPAAQKRESVVEAAAIDWSSCRRPEYPDASVRRGEEGVVITEINVSASAEVTGHRIAQSSGFDRLDRAAVNAILKCHFQPETVDGVARAGKASVRFAWKLN